MYKSRLYPRVGQSVAIKDQVHFSELKRGGGSVWGYKQNLKSSRCYNNTVCNISVSASFTKGAV